MTTSQGEHAPTLVVVGVPLPLPVSLEGFTASVPGVDQAGGPPLSPLPMEQEGDPQELPPNTQVTPVPESVRLWLSEHNFCLVKAKSVQRDFAGFTDAGAPCLIVGECPAQDEPLEHSTSESESDSAVMRACRRDPGIARIIRTTILGSDRHGQCPPVPGTSGEGQQEVTVCQQSGVPPSASGSLSHAPSVSQESQKTEKYFSILDKAMTALGKVATVPQKAWFALDAFKPEMAKMQADGYLEQVSRQALEDPTRLSVRKIPTAVARWYSTAPVRPPQRQCPVARLGQEALLEGHRRGIC